MGGGRSAQYAPTLLPSTRSCREPIFAPFSPSSSWSRRTELVWDWNGPNNNAATPFSPLPPFFAARLGRFIFATATVVSSLSPPIPSFPPYLQWPRGTRGEKRWPTLTITAAVAYGRGRGGKECFPRSFWCPAERAISDCLMAISASSPPLPFYQCIFLIV